VDQGNIDLTRIGGGHLALNGVCKINTRELMIYVFWNRVRRASGPKW
jgi:hypothetical protein